MDGASAENEIGVKSGKERLEELAKTGEYVFHGSGVKLESLEPRQQTSFNSKTGQTELDGNPAICATENPDIAIFRALTNKQRAIQLGIKNYYTHFDMNNGQASFGGNEASIDIARRPDIKGYVYVFSKNDFQPHNDLEVRAYRKLKPVFTIEVKASDLPKNIEITKEIK